MHRKYSIKKNSDFMRIYRRKKTSVDRNIVMYMAKNQLSHSRLGISVSKKVGNAVIRNKVKRQLREIFRLNRDKFNNNYDIVIVARKRSATATYQQMEISFLRHCRQLKIMDLTEEVTIG